MNNRDRTLHLFKKLLKSLEEKGDLEHSITKAKVANSNLEFEKPKLFAFQQANYDVLKDSNSDGIISNQINSKLPIILLLISILISTIYLVLKYTGIDLSFVSIIMWLLLVGQLFLLIIILKERIFIFSQEEKINAEIISKNINGTKYNNYERPKEVRKIANKNKLIKIEKEKRDKAIEEKQNELVNKNKEINNMYIEMERSGIFLPKKREDDLEEIIQIIEDGRADTVKEAINVLERNKFEEEKLKLEYQYRMQELKEIERHNREIEKAEKTRNDTVDYTVCVGCKRLGHCLRKPSGNYCPYRW